MQNALRVRGLIQGAFWDHVPSVSRSFRIIPDPKRPGQTDTGPNDQKASGEGVLDQEVEALSQTGQKEKGEDQSFGLSDQDQKAARERGYDKPQMSRNQSESGDRTSDVREDMKKDKQNVDKEGGGEQVMRELQPGGPGKKPEQEDSKSGPTAGAR